MFDENGVPYALVTVGVDVTEQRRRKAALRRQAETDHVTGLADRAGKSDRPSGVPASTRPRSACW